MKPGLLGPELLGLGSGRHQSEKRHQETDADDGGKNLLHRLDRELEEDHA